MTWSEIVRLAALREIDEAPMHGYVVQRNLRMAGIIPSTSTGGLFRTLRALDAEGLLTFSWDVSTSPARKVYTITPAGRRELLTERKRLHDFVATLSAVLSRTPRS